MDREIPNHDMHTEHIRRTVQPNPAAAVIHRESFHAYPVHSHGRFYVFANITKGSCVCFGKKTAHPKRSVTAGEGDIVIINPGQPHSGYPAGDRPYSYRALYVNADYMEELITGRVTGQYPVFHPSILRTPGCLNEYGGCISTALPSGPDSGSGDVFYQKDRMTAVFEEYLIQFVANLEESGTLALQDETAGDGNEYEEAAIGRIKEYIMKNLTGKITLDGIAAECGRSKYHLVRTFKASTGLPPLQYQSLERINASKGLLKEGYSLADAAYTMGFYDQSHFQNCFKSFTGLTPSQYVKGQHT